jgi:uncharacterized protein with von Willebrand factor type A (vWA) domain
VVSVEWRIFHFCVCVCVYVIERRRKVEVVGMEKMTKE